MEQMVEGASRSGAKLLGCTKVDVHHVCPQDVDVVVERADGHNTFKQSGELPNDTCIMRMRTLKTYLLCGFH